MPEAGGGCGRSWQDAGVWPPSSVPLVRRSPELGWLAAVAFAAWLIARTAFDDLGVPAGSDWGVYLKDAARIWVPESGLPFNDWRRPLHGYLVGLFGAERGYVEAARLISAVGGVATVVAAGVAGRALGGPWVAALAALSVPFLQVPVDAAHWTNHYGLLGAAVGLALAAGACACRWGSVTAALAAGLFGGFAYALDLRGLAGAGTAAGLVVLALGADVAWWRRLLLPLAFAGGLALPVMQSERVAEVAGLSAMPFDVQVRVQRALTLDAIRLEGGGQGGQLQACIGLEPTLMTLEGLQEPCSEALFRSNLARIRSHLPPAGLWWLLLPAFLPAVWGRRAALAGFGVLVGPTLGALVGLAWVHGHMRYLTPLTVPLAVLIPLGLHRLTERFPLPVRVAGGLVALYLTVSWWPRISHRERAWPDAPRDRPTGLTRLADHLLAEGTDEPVIDCAGTGVEVYALPVVLDMEVLVGASPQRCLHALSDLAASGDAGWGVTLLRGDAATMGVVLDQEPVESLGFERALVVSQGAERFALWRIEP